MLELVFDEMGDIAVERVVVDGVALVGGCDGGVRFGFTERTGGVSEAPYTSLNLGSTWETISKPFWRTGGARFMRCVKPRLSAAPGPFASMGREKLCIPQRVFGKDEKKL